MSEGKKFDEGKNMMDLLPPEFEEAVAHILTFGAHKYTAHNWRKGINYSRVLAAHQRHMAAFRRGERIDPESGMPHLWHAACNLAFLVTYEANIDMYKEFNDLYWADTITEEEKICDKQYLKQYLKDFEKLQEHQQKQETYEEFTGVKGIKTPMYTTQSTKKGTHNE